MADLTQLQTWLSEAEAARHQLAMGERVVEVWRDGRRVTYATTDLTRLDDYVALLENQIAAAKAAADGKPARTAIGVRY